MNIYLVLLELLGGFILLVLGARFLVRGTIAAAYLLKLAPYLIGLTVVAYSTNAPELFVCLQAAFSKHSGITLGNVIGSNLFNIGAGFTLSCLIRPFKINKHLLRFDVPWMIAATAVFYLISLIRVWGKLEGLFAILIFVCYAFYSIKFHRKHPIGEEVPKVKLKWPLASLNIFLGLVVLLIGAELFVRGSVSVSLALGVSELWIGLTLVAIGTSLPELATSLSAVLHNEGNIALGNIIGSNLLNLLGIFGLTVLLSPSPILVPTKALTVDLPAVFLLTILMIPFKGQRYSRYQPIVLLIGYLCFLYFTTMGQINALYWSFLVIYILIAIFCLIQLVKKNHSSHFMK